MLVSTENEKYQESHTNSLGGYAGAGNYSNHIFQLDTKSNVWMVLQENIQLGRQEHTLAVLPHRMVADYCKQSFMI